MISTLPILPGFLTRLLPESPRFLAMKGRNEEALLVLARLHAHGDVNDPFVVAEHQEIVQGIEIERRETADAFVQLVTQKSNLRRLMLGIALQFSVQMTGVSCIQYFSPQIFARCAISASHISYFER